MSKKALIQYLILFTILIIITYVYFNYFRNPVENVKDKNRSINKPKIISETSKDIIKDLKYSSEDSRGNKYHIKSQEGVIEPNEKSIIIMQHVMAEVTLFNGEKIYISSDKAKYNNDNYDTLFEGSVKMNYKDHSMKSESLDLSFKKQQAKLSDNVFYKSSISELRADKILVDLLNMSTKFLMNEKNKKVLVKTVINNGNN